jgi:phage terminase large subunit GpA-like protein
MGLPTFDPPRLVSPSEWARSFADGLRPDPILTVSEWADAHRVLSMRSSAEPGPWRTERTPYLREIMDCLAVSCPIQRIVFMAGAQVGKTETGNNWTGYVIDHSPGPMLYIEPTVDLAKRVSKQRIDPMIETSPRLRAKVAPARSRDSGNTVLGKQFPGGELAMVGANSAVGLRSMPARFVYKDEVDAWPGDVDGEGDPSSLADRATRTFARRKIFETSTPTIAGRSRIERSFLESDRRYFHVPCPDCGGHQRIKFTNLRWEKGDPTSAVLACELCGSAIEETKKTWLLANGLWVPEVPERSDVFRGYHLNSLYSPRGWFSWKDAAEMFERAAGKPDVLRVFVNTVLGETWREKGEAPEWEDLYRRREKYAIGTVPLGALLLTAGADVQRDRLEVEIVGWGRGKESWSIAYYVIPGDPATAAPWAALSKILDQKFPQEREGGTVELPVSMLAVDSGDQTQIVYQWVRAQSPNRVIATKGQRTEFPVLVGQPHAVDVNFGGKKIRKGVKVWPIGSSLGKSEFYAWLRLKPPLEEREAFPAGFVHFPEYAEEWFRQITAEQLMAGIVKGHRVYSWELLPGRRNEALDCRILARVAAAVFGVDRWTPENWATLEAMLAPGGGFVPKPPPKSNPNRRPGYIDGWRSRKRT